MRRTPYMQLVMNSTYSQVAINAIISGRIEGAWEKAIAERLHRDYKEGSPLPMEVLKQFGIEPEINHPSIWLNAAYFIISSESQLEKT